MPKCATAILDVPRKLSRGRVVMYSVFGDESHDEKNERVFAVAGLFGSDEDWKQLRAKWINRTGGKNFHAAACETGKGDYAGAPDVENKALYKDLTQLLCASRLMGFGAAIDLAGHRLHFPDIPVDIPYYWCFRKVVHQCGKWTRWSVPQDTVKFTFDQRKESDYNAGVLYNYM